MPDLANIEQELRKFIERHNGAAKQTAVRVLAFEQAVAGGPGPGFAGSQTIGKIFVESEGHKRLQSGAKEFGKAKIESFYQKAIINATSRSFPICKYGELFCWVETIDGKRFAVEQQNKFEPCLSLAL